jgi:hypothetical protein
MSIVVSVRVGDGLVIAADSASTLSAADPRGKELGIAKVFNNATKLLQLRDYPVGVATVGAGTIGARTISSLVEEFANERPTLGQLGAKKLSVEKEAKDLQRFLMDAYNKAYPDKTAQRGGPALLVGGYSGVEFFPEEYVFNVPQGEFEPRRTPNPNGSQNFGADWIGITDALVRFHWGRDDRTPAILKDCGIADDMIAKVMAAFQAQVQYPVPFDGMPLQDAVDYALFMAGLAVGRFRFVIGPEMCGGPIDVATITRQGGFQWVKQKNVKAGAWMPIE